MRYYLLLLLWMPLLALGQNMDSLILDSEVLDRQIEVFLLDLNQGNEGPIFYFTDGKKMIDNGTSSLIDSLSRNKQISNAKYVFISTINPKTQEDHREEYFFCNESFVLFFENELIPSIEGGNRIDQKRFLIGVSFGGMNAAFLAAKTNIFKGFGILSPITYPCEDLNQIIAFSKYQNYKVYISTGYLDAEHYVETLYPILQSKTKNLKLVNTKSGHDFENWNGQLLNVITFMEE